MLLKAAQAATCRDEPFSKDLVCHKTTMTLLTYNSLHDKLRSLAPSRGRPLCFRLPLNHSPVLLRVRVERDLIIPA